MKEVKSIRCSLNPVIKQLNEAKSKRWLVTGAAGFIGSHLVEVLLELEQHVVGLDNLSTGNKDNLVEVQKNVGNDKWGRFKFIEGDILDLECCQQACNGVDFVLHQAALGSVPRSLADPLATNSANVTGFLNVITVAKNLGVSRVVYASSSSVYGSHEALPKKEENIGGALSPYALSKRVNELYAGVFKKCYDLSLVGLRYFNVFGPRQDPHGQYAAVIPKWISAIIKNQEVQIFGDGETTRDFCYVKNVVQANILSALGEFEGEKGAIMNVAVSEQISLSKLYELIREIVAHRITIGEKLIKKLPERDGDIKQSLADISLIRGQIGYKPEFNLQDGLEKTVDWHLKKNDKER